MRLQRVGHDWVTELNWTELDSRSVQSFSLICHFWDPKDCSPPGSSIHGISQARLLAWAAICFCRGSSWPGDRLCVSCLAGRSFTTEPPGKPNTIVFIPNSTIQVLPAWRMYIIYLVSGCCQISHSWFFLLPLLNYLQFFPVKIISCICPSPSVHLSLL